MGRSFVQRLSSSHPVPGGGAAAAYCASVALALLEKICRVELGRLDDSSPKVLFWQNILAKVRKLIRSLTVLREEDGEAYLNLAEAKALYAAGDERLGDALRAAIECPLDILRAVNVGLTCLSAAGESCRAHLLSDLLVVAELLSATGTGVNHIIKANLTMCTNISTRDSYLKDLETINAEIYTLCSKVKELIIARQTTMTNRRAGSP